MTIPTLTFSGNDGAEWFTRECRESLDGLCTWNLVREPGELPVGFVHASPPGQGWAFTMWTRDAGVLLRELVLWGRFDEARLVAGCLMDLVTRNEQGFHAFPERFDRGKPGCGHEIDGTCAIVIRLFHERMYCPPLPDAARKGCGELNLVCAAEPLKIARLILGIDDRAGEPLRLVPRLPRGWSRCQVRDWPVLLSDGLALADIDLEHGADGTRLRLAFQDSRRTNEVRLRLAGRRHSFDGLRGFDLHLPCAGALRGASCRVKAE